MGWIFQSTAELVTDGIRNYFTYKWIIAILIIIIIHDQISYISKKGSISGSKFKIWPIIGPFLDSLNPEFENYKTQWAAGPLSCVSVFNKFIVFGSARDIALKALNSPSYVKPCLVESAAKIIRPTNWVILDTKAHLRYRRSLSRLFTRNALQTYLPYQEEIYDKYLEKWVEYSNRHGPRKYYDEFWYLNCAVSLRTFCGSYISEDQVSSIADNFHRVAEALDLVSFPIILPYTKAWYGRNVANMTMDILAECAQKSRENIGAGGSVECVMDAWVKSMLDSKDGSSKSSEFTNKEISETVFTFLFAGQDTTSCAVVWLFQFLADRPDVMRKVREEQLAVRDGNSDKRIGHGMINQMIYTEMVVKETIRCRPPVLMVPYLVKEDFPVTNDYTVPKGSMFIPSFYPALQDPDVYDEPETFNPERWVEGSRASLSQKNWLAFGSGNHSCIGQNYAMMHLTTLIGKACMLYDWKHIITPQSDKIQMRNTICPGDGCILEFSKRENPDKMD